MVISISSDTLYNSLSALSKTLGSGNKNSSSILNCFLFQVTDGTLKVTASDSENTMSMLIPLAESDSNGMFAINSQHILNAVKDLADQPINISIDENTKAVSMTYANGNYNFVADDAEVYPQVQTLESSATVITMQSQLLAETIERTIFATADDQLRLVMNGIYFDLKEDKAVIVASDGHKLVRNQLQTVKAEIPTAFILPKKPAMLLKNTLPKDESEVTLSFDSRNAQIQFENTTLTCRLIEGRYPNYNSVIPKDNPYQVEVERKALLGALKRVLPFASESSQLVRLDISENFIHIKSEDLEFAKKAVENVSCNYAGAPVSIGFKGTALQAVLSNLSFDDVNLCIGDPSRPCLVIPVEQPENVDILMLLMPMLLND